MLCILPGSAEAIIPFHTKVKVDCWSSLCQSLICLPGSTVLITSMSIASTSIIDYLYVDHWSAPTGSTVLTASALIASMSIIDCLYIDLPLQDQQHWLPPQWSPLHWSPITSMSTIDPPRVNSVDCLYIDHWLPLHWLSIDPPTFLTFNIRTVHSCIISFVCWPCKVHNWVKYEGSNLNHIVRRAI